MRKLAFLFTTLGLLLGMGLAARAQTTFTNSSSITINDDNVATPYPSNITVSGLGNVIASTPTSVSVRLNNVSHTCPDDIAIALVGPTGAAFRLQDGAGDGNCADLVNVSYSLRDSAAALLPNAGVWTAGTYKPTAYYASPLNADFPTPGPGTTYNSPGPDGTSTLQATFGGTNPNGIWKLYVLDASPQDAGAIAGGWSLTITTTNTAADATVGGNVLTPSGAGLVGATVQLTDSRGVTRSVTTGRRGVFAFTEVETGETYVLSIRSNLYEFSPQVITVNDSIGNIEFLPDRGYTGSR
jgi:subtilisin-like proprotein convertase family protein